jgi:hypothetical protein
MDACYRNEGEKLVRVLLTGERPGRHETVFQFGAGAQGPPGPAGLAGVGSEAFSLIVNAQKIINARISSSARTLIGELHVPPGSYMVFARAEVLWSVGGPSGVVNPNESMRLWLSGANTSPPSIDSVQDARSTNEFVDVLTLMGTTEGVQNPLRIRLEGATAQVNCGVGSAVVHAIKVGKITRTVVN